MYETIDYSKIYGNEDNYIFIDARTPKEAYLEPIIGAINIPVLLDDERDIVGTLYVRESVEKAKEVGVEFISKRLPEIFKQIQSIYNENEDKQIVIFCARGGMRSGSLVSFLNSLGIKVFKLSGGYKAYRAFVANKLEEYAKEVNFIVLYGNTGVGKTEMLYELKRRGYDTLDLEGSANHRGSILGGVGLGDCYTQKRFESLVYEQLRQRKTNLVFTEGESRRIGRILIPEFLFNKIYEGKKIRITSDYEVRAKRLVKEYTSFENVGEQLEQALGVLGKHISVETVEQYKKLVADKKYEEVAIELMKRYYDPMYGVSAKKHVFRNFIEINDFYKGIEVLENLYKEIDVELGEDIDEKRAK